MMLNFLLMKITDDQIAKLDKLGFIWEVTSGSGSKKIKN